VISAWNVDHGIVSKTFIPGKGYVSATKLVQESGKPALRTAVRNQRAAKSRVAAEEKAHFQEYRSQHDLNTKLLDQLERKGKARPSPKAGVAFAEPDFMTGMTMKAQNMEAFAMHTGGRRGRRVMVVPPGSSQHTVNHEIAHLTPKRSGYRLFQILGDGKRLMSEEARAEMASGSKLSYYRNATPAQAGSGYTQAAVSPEAQRILRSHEEQKALWNKVPDKKMFTDESMDAFRRTQDKIHAARKRPAAYTAPREFHGNQYVDEKKQRKTRRNIMIFGGGAGAAGAGGYGFHRYKKRSRS